MNEFEISIPHYGYVSGEIVEWEITPEMNLIVRTQLCLSITIEKGAWMFRRTFFGSGKIEFTASHAGGGLQGMIRIAPAGEYEFNRKLFQSDKSNAFGGQSRPFRALSKMM